MSRDREIIWRPEGNYKNLFDIFCNMRDRGMLQITQHHVTDTAMYYKLEILITNSHLFLRYLKYLLRTRL